jgi:phosphotransferase system HPr (HPr) family protein
VPKQTFETETEIKNPEGLHMRPAMLFVDLANTFESDITVSHGDVTVDAKSIMQMTMLAATHGTRLKIRAEGTDAQKAAQSLQLLVDRQFSADSAAVGEKEG